MFGQFCCCANSDQQSTMEVKTREHRFEGSTKSIQIGNRDHVLVLSPDAAAQRSDVAPTVWRTTQVQQPMNIVFTYSNRQQLQRQIPSQPAYNVGQALSSNIAQPHTATVTQALSPKNPMFVHQTNIKKSTDFDMKIQNSPIAFQPSMKQEYNVHSWQPEIRHPPSHQNEPYKQPATVDHQPNQNAYFKSRSPQPLNQYLFDRIPQPIEHNQVENSKHQTFDIYKNQFAFHDKPHTSQSPTPIQNLKSEQSTNLPVYLDYKKEAEEPSMLSNTISQKPTEKTTQQKQAFKKKGSKAQGRKRDTSASSRGSNKITSNPKITSPNSKSKGLSSTKKLVSQRLLEHRPCGRRHCTACQLKRKQESSKK